MEKYRDGNNNALDVSDKINLMSENYRLCGYSIF